MKPQLIRTLRMPLGLAMAAMSSIYSVKTVGSL